MVQIIINKYFINIYDVRLLWFVELNCDINVQNFNVDLYYIFKSIEI